MSPRRCIAACALPAALLLSSGLPARGADWSSVRGIGMGRTAAAAGRGLEAVGINPALLATEHEATVTVGIAPVSVHFGSDILTVGSYNRYFTGVGTDTGTVAYYLTDADKASILEQFGDAPTGMTYADADAGLLGLSFHLGDAGSFALTVSERAAAFADIPRDYAEFLFFGNPPGSAFDFSATDLKASWLREYGLTYARSLPAPEFLTELYAGATLKLVSGFGYAEVLGFTTTLATDDAGVLSGDVHFRARTAGAKILNDGLGPHLEPFPKASGSGVGADLGVSGVVDGWLTVALSVTDIGSVAWSGDVEERSADTSYVIDNPLDEGQRDFIENSLTGEVRKGEAFQTSLPTTLRVGAAMAVHTLAAGGDFPGELVVAAEYQQGFANVPGATTTPRGALGAEYRPIPALPLRAGVSVGGYDGLAFALGFGLHAGPLEFDVATSNVTSLFAGDDMAHGSAAVGLRMRF